MKLDPQLVEDVCLGNVRDAVHKFRLNIGLIVCRYLMQKRHTTSEQLF
jgi:hypothetical protein